MAYQRALFFSGLLCLAITAAGAAYVDNSGNVYATQSQAQASENDAYYNSGPVNQQSSNQGIQQAGNGNSAANSNTQKIKGRKLLAYYTIDNHGDVTADQSQSQTSTNEAVGNSGPVNQQSSNQAIQQAGNGNSATNSNAQKINGRRLQGYYIDNHGNVHATQSQAQTSTNEAVGNSGPVNQQSSNQATQQAGNGNSAENDNNQYIEGRRLLAHYYVDNSGDVTATQSQAQTSTNDAEYNSGPVNQQSSNQGIQQAGNGNSAENDNSQYVEGRRLLAVYYVDNSGDVTADQAQSQTSTNDAEYNSGPVNQQSSNQGIQQAGNGDSAENDNSQYIEGRRLLADYYIDNHGNVHATQSQSQSSTNDAEYNSGPVNQQSSNQATQQAGNGNSAYNGNAQTIKGRRLQGYYVDNHGDVVATQSQAQTSANDAEYNSGPVNQQSSNQAIQQAGNGNYASNANKQTIKP